MDEEKRTLFDAVFTVLLVCSVVLTVAALVLSCTPASRDWRANTSIDIGVGGASKDVWEGAGYLGASYYLDYGVSASVGLWSSPELFWGPYWGINYSWGPFE